jgi:hypothetical protein
MNLHHLVLRRSCGSGDFRRLRPHRRRHEHKGQSESHGGRGGQGRTDRCRRSEEGGHFDRNRRFTGPQGASGCARPQDRRCR